MADVNLFRTDSCTFRGVDSVTDLVQRTPTTKADFVVFAESIFPTEQDVAAVPGDGITLTEENLAYWGAAQCPTGGGGTSSGTWRFANRILTGCKLPPPTPGSLDLTIQAGRAWIGGYHLIIPATVITGTATFTNSIYLKVSRDANSRVTSGVYEVNTTGVKPPSSLYIGTADCDGSQVTATADTRSFGQTGTIGWTIASNDRLPDGTLPLNATHATCATYENLFDLAISNLSASPWFARGTPLGTVTADSSTDRFTLASHGLGNGQVVHFSSTVTLPGGANTLQKYYIVNKTTNDFQIAHIPLGAVIDLTSAGSGTISVYNKFLLADIESRFVLSAGSGSGLTTRALGASGGEETHALTTTETPAHPHTGATIDVWTIASAGTPTKPLLSTGGGASTYPVTIPSSGGSGGAHNTMPPYLTFNVYVWT